MRALEVGEGSGWGVVSAERVLSSIGVSPSPSISASATSASVDLSICSGSFTGARLNQLRREEAFEVEDGCARGVGAFGGVGGARLDEEGEGGGIGDFGSAGWKESEDFFFGAIEEGGDVVSDSRERGGISRRVEGALEPVLVEEGERRAEVSVCTADVTAADLEDEPAIQLARDGESPTCKLVLVRCRLTT